MAEIANLNTRLSLESASFISGIEKSRGALRSLIASIDPAAAAQAKFNRETQLLEGALKRGQITAEAYGRGMEVLKQRLTAATTQQNAVIASTGNVRAGMQQLSFQLGDIATQWASGTKPMVIFAQQSGQVIQALGMMTGSARGLLGFLGGPWGQIITAATIVLTPFIAKLFDSADAADAATDSVNNYANALKKLQEQGGAFSFGSPEFRKVSTDLLQREASVGRLRQELAGAPTSTGPSIITPGGTAHARATKTRADIQRELDAAIAARDEVRGDLNALLIQRRNNDIANAPRSPRERRRRGPSAEQRAIRADRMEERFNDQAAQLQQQQLGLLQGITSDYREQARLQHEQVTLELEAYQRDLEHSVAQKEITAAKAQELLVVKQRNAELERTRINWALDDKLTRDELALTESRLELASDALAGDLDAARTQEERRRIQLALLENEKELARASLLAVQARHDSTETEKLIAQARLNQLDAEFGRRAAGIRRGTMGPLEQWADNIPRSAEEINEAFDAIAADGLQSFNDGIADAITGARSLGDVFNDVAGQIISDLARIAIQKSITAPLAQMLGLAAGSGDWASGARGSVDALGIPAFANGGSLRLGGVSGVDTNVLSLNGSPIARVSRGELMNVSPANDRGGIARVVIEEAPGFASRVAGISGNVAIETAKVSSTASYRRGRQRLDY